LIKRHFDNEKVQEIYNTEYAKEIAKMDAAKEKNNSKSFLFELIFICILGALLIFLWKSFL
jgi:hypothetical protein